MGCLCDKNKRPKDVIAGVNKGYSWDQRDGRVDPKDFTIENTEGTEVWKLPGTISGQQFIVRNCKNSTIYLLDHINTLTVDDCNDSKFIVGPVKGSVFLRDCKDCSILVACGQFRMRDCHNFNVFLCCPTQPIIESSHRMHFGCYQLYYDKLEGQFKAADLSVFNNNWSNVHDFTPSHGDTNWCILPTTMSVTDYFQQPPQSDDTLNMSLSKASSVVPLTAGLYPDPSDDLETCLVVFFHDTKEEAVAKLFIKTLLDDRPHCWLVNCRQLMLEPRDAQVVFSSNAYNQLIQTGPLIGLVWTGPRVIYSCQKTVEKVMVSSDLVYVSSNPRTAPIQAETFTSIASMILLS